LTLKKPTPDSLLTLRMTTNQVLHSVQDDKTVCHPEQREGSVFDSRKTNTGFFADAQNDNRPDSSLTLRMTTIE